MVKQPCTTTIYCSARRETFEQAEKLRQYQTESPGLAYSIIRNSRGPFYSAVYLGITFVNRKIP